LFLTQEKIDVNYYLVVAVGVAGEVEDEGEDEGDKIAYAI